MPAAWWMWPTRPRWLGSCRTMLDNPEQRRRLGEHAAESIRRYSDLPARSAEALLSLLPRA